MPVNTDLAALSKTPSLNGPAGTDPPSTLDDAIRYSLSFTASLRDGLGFTPGAIVSALGFTPVQQGTGFGQNTSRVQIGWSSSNQLRLSVDSTDFGPDWPINIRGMAAAATNATYATSAGAAASATNANYATSAGTANKLGTFFPEDFVRRSSTNAILFGWDGSRINASVDGITKSIRVDWGALDNVPTTLVQRHDNSIVEVGAPDNSGAIGSAIPNTDGRIRSINAGSGTLIAVVDGAAFSWPINVSDARLKENIQPTREDSLSKVNAIEFRSFRFNDVLPMIKGATRKLGVIAQQLEQVDRDWVMHEGKYRQLNIETMLTSAMHAIQQLSAEVRELRERGRP